MPIAATLTAQGVEIPRLGFGTWRLTGDACAERVRHALELGYRHIDTARAYDNEAAVGHGLRESGVAREDVFVTTKVWYDQLEPPKVAASAEASLRELRLDYVDLLLIHWPSPEGVPLEATLEAMRDLQARGLIRALGVSNFPPGLFRQALELAPVATNQVEYHPFLGQERLLDVVAEHDTSLTAYAPLAKGKVTEEETIRSIARQRSATPAQIALRWLLDHERVVVVPKAASADRRAENLAALEIELSDEERASIDALPKDQRDVNVSWAPDWDA